MAQRRPGRQRQQTNCIPIDVSREIHTKQRNANNMRHRQTQTEPTLPRLPIDSGCPSLLDISASVACHPRVRWTLNDMLVCLFGVRCAINSFALFMFPIQSTAVILCRVSHVSHPPDNHIALFTSVPLSACCSKPLKSTDGTRRTHRSPSTNGLMVTQRFLSHHRACVAFFSFSFSLFLNRSRSREIWVCHCALDASGWR